MAATADQRATVYPHHGGRGVGHVPGLVQVKMNGAVGRRLVDVSPLDQAIDGGGFGYLTSAVGGEGEEQRESD